MHERSPKKRGRSENMVCIRVNRMLLVLALRNLFSPCSTLSRIPKRTRDTQEWSETELWSVGVGVHIYGMRVRVDVRGIKSGRWCVCVCVAGRCLYYRHSAGGTPGVLGRSLVERLSLSHLLVSTARLSPGVG
jgi:hypothetical protein